MEMGKWYKNLHIQKIQYFQIVVITGVAE